MKSNPEKQFFMIKNFIPFFEPNLPSPMMRAVFVKLAVLRNRHSAWPRRTHFKIYLNIFIQIFKYLIDILRNAVAR